MSFRVQASVPQHFYWLKGRTGCALEDGFRAIEAVDEHDVDWCPACGRWHGLIRGMVGFGSWTPNSVSMHVAVEHPIAVRTLAPAAFEYAFLQAGKKLVVGVTPGDNAKALAFNKHIGFREVYRLKDGWSDGVDMVIQEMHRHECKWLKENAHG